MKFNTTKSFSCIRPVNQSHLVIVIIVFQDFYKHYTNCQKPQKGSSDAPQVERKFSDQMKIFKEIWAIGMSVWGVFAVTLSAFPVLCVKIISTTDNETWSGMISLEVYLLSKKIHVFTIIVLHFPF